MKKQMVMIDLSSNNAPPNLKQLWKNGARIIGLKGAEDVTYRWKQCETLAKQWHKLGGICVYYDFIHPTRPQMQATYFWSYVQHFYQQGDWLACDAEVSGVKGAQVKTWHYEIKDLTSHHKRPVQRLTYGSPSFLVANHIGQYYGERLWLAEYGPKADVPKAWTTWTMWQISSHVHVQGVSGEVDLSKLRHRVFEPTLERGDKNICVMHLKHMLREQGYKGFRTNSFKFGIGLHRAVKKFKAANHLHADGVAGRAVWHKLHGHVK